MDSESEILAAFLAAVKIFRKRTISRKDLDLPERRLSMYSAQKVPERIGYYLAGFADGEGSFNLSFRKRDDYQSPWKISLCFNISQKDPVILSLFKKHLQCGTLRQRSDGCWYYEVNNLKAIEENVIPFFRRFQFLSAKKKRGFSKFRQLLKVIKMGNHLTEEGVREILQIRREMNDGGKRKFTEEEILSRFKNPQRLNAKHT